MTRKLYVLAFIYTVTWDHCLSRITDPKNNHFLRVLFLIINIKLYVCKVGISLLKFRFVFIAINE